MKHAGVAITITSVTDLLAFGIGASSTLPALRSFSVFCSLGIFAVFLCIITFFTAWFSLDQRRIEGSHNAFVCCYKHKAQETAKCKRKPFLKTAFVFLSDSLTRWPVKAVVLVFSVSLGIVELKYSVIYTELAMCTELLRYPISIFHDKIIYTYNNDFRPRQSC